MKMTRTLKYSLPLLGFFLVAALLYRGLALNPSEVPSPFIGKPAPTFTLAGLAPYSEGLSSADLNGKVWLLNVFASWCRECIAEHEVIKKLAQATDAPVLGLNYKDKSVDAVNWLQKLGNPYDAVLVDDTGDTGIDWGVYGVPETFVMDRNGVVRYKHIGPVTEKVLNDTLLPLLTELNQAS